MKLSVKLFLRLWILGGFFVCSVANAQVPASRAPKDSKFKYNRVDVPPASCQATERPTGCRAPNRECMTAPFKIGRRPRVALTEPRAICREAQQKVRCSNFTWEKCCVDNCKQIAGKNFGVLDQCIGTCNNAPEGLVYFDKVAVVVKKRKK